MENVAVFFYKCSPKVARHFLTSIFVSCGLVTNEAVIRLRFLQVLQIHGRKSCTASTFEALVRHFTKKCCVLVVLDMDK